MRTFFWLAMTVLSVAVMVLALIAIGRGVLDNHPHAVGLPTLVLMFASILMRECLYLSQEDK